MKQTARIISTYTADVSGAASALFELGGMTVMHDASGCNSTYNTHDEPRWYDQDSLVFISALSEMEAILGDDEKLVSDITAAALELKPRFIAIAGTPIPMITGTDLPAVARRVERNTGIPAFGLKTNSMHSYLLGAGMALELAATLVSVTLVFLGALLTGIGVYDDLAKIGGAGTLVPITGFANSVVAPALEFKTEGFVTGTGAKMFIISGPVITYGISASVVYGLIYYLTTAFTKAK